MEQLISTMKKVLIPTVSQSDKHSEDLIHLLSITKLPILLAVLNVFIITIISFREQYWDLKFAFFSVILASIVECLIWCKSSYRIDFIFLTIIYTILIFFILGMTFLIFLIFLFKF